MTNNLKISCIQSDLIWENIDQNLNEFKDKLNQIPNKTDIVVLPEMFTTGFSMNSIELAETMDGKSFLWMKTQANKNNKTNT